MLLDEHGAHQSLDLGLIAGAVRLPPAGGPLILYGPWLSDDVPAAPSNLAFDSDLKQRNSDWGLRRIEDCRAAAEQRGLELVETRSMPANNMMMLAGVVKRSFTARPLASGAWTRAA